MTDRRHPSGTLEEPTEIRLYMMVDAKGKMSGDIGMMVYAIPDGRLFRFDTLEEWTPTAEWKLKETTPL
jgi:hypothetical protein